MGGWVSPEGSFGSFWEVVVNGGNKCQFCTSFREFPVVSQIYHNINRENKGFDPIQHCFLFSKFHFNFPIWDVWGKGCLTY